MIQDKIYEVFIISRFSHISIQTNGLYAFVLWHKHKAVVPKWEQCSQLSKEAEWCPQQCRVIKWCPGESCDLKWHPLWYKRIEGCPYLSKKSGKARVQNRWVIALSWARDSSLNCYFLAMALAHDASHIRHFISKMAFWRLKKFAATIIQPSFLSD